MGKSEIVTSNREKLLKKISECRNFRLADIMAQGFGCVENIDGVHRECYRVCRQCWERWLNETKERDR